ncbi:uncharacterized protein LOC135210706 [Macrobrachium nipponense]|uniref:uncharacterized protein LOC135210706 n=1 Tax=Macrobrachium nipponense TaxID=159736 RepID=UPI0030C7CEB6
MAKEAFFPEMTFGERHFNYHEIIDNPHKNKRSNHSSAHCHSSPQLEDAHLYEDWDAQDQAVCKGEEFEDESEMKHASVAGCDFNSKLLSVNKVENSDEMPNYNDNFTSVLASKFQGPNKKMRRISLGRIPNHVKCFSCERYIKESHFSEHLLFGEVRCAECGSHFSDCRSFMVWVAQCAEGAIKVCDHRFVFTNDPLTYIAGKLSVGGAVHSLVDEELLNELERYIYKIRSLESRLPWQHAMVKCKEHVALEKSKKFSADNDRVHCSEHLITKNEYKSIEDLRSFTEMQTVFLPNTFQDGEEMLDSGQDSSSALNDDAQFYELTEAEMFQPSTCYKDKEYFVNSQELSYITSTEMASSASTRGKYNKVTNHPFLDNTQFSGIPVNNKEIVPDNAQSSKTGHETDKCGTATTSGHETDKCGTATTPGYETDKCGTATTSGYETDKCGTATTSGQETDKCGTATTPASESNKSNSHFKEKVSPKKQKKKPRPFYRKKKPKANVSVNLVPQPSDGFYYITKKPIEECPNCYCILCPSASTVNCRTFLITFICPDCNLVIYIANDDTYIITDKESESLKKPLPGKSKKHVSNSKSCSDKKSSFQKSSSLTTNPFILK